MNIELTIKEAETLLQEQNGTFKPFGTAPVTFKIEPHAQYHKPEFDIIRALTIARSIYGYRHEGKIPAIKAVREYAANCGISIGLVSAKQFVEAI